MKRQALVATLIALAIAVAVPAAMADSSIVVTPANGSDYILPDGSVYQLNDDGSYSWIPNVATGNAMGLDWTSLIPVPYLDGTVGDPFPSVQSLSNASFNRTGGSSSTSSSVSVTPANGVDYYLPNGQVYQDNLDGTCSWIPDVATGNAMHLDWNDMIAVDDVTDLPCDIGTPFPHVD
jgi:hypothetical protein